LKRGSPETAALITCGAAGAYGEPRWGEPSQLPPGADPKGPSVLRRIRGTDLPVHVGYVDDQGNEIALADVAMIPADSLQD
jgi:hypothetical protein